MDRPGRATHPSPGAEPPAGPCGVPAVRRLLRAGHPGVLVPAGHLREERRGDDFRTLRHPGGPVRARPGDRAVVGGEPRTRRGGGVHAGDELRSQHHAGRGLVDPAPPDAAAGAPLGDHAAREPPRLPQVPGPFPVTSIRLKYVNRPASAERFVPREEAPQPEENQAASPERDSDIAASLLPEADAGHAHGEVRSAPDARAAPKDGVDGKRTTTVGGAVGPRGSKPETPEPDNSEPAARPAQAATAPHPERNGKAGGRDPGPGKALY